MLTELADANKVIGLKQTKKALRDKVARKVYVAMDADVRMREMIIALCEEADVLMVEVPCKDDLGHACGINVSAAVAAIL